ncbi:transcription factor bHLH160-like isoform X1 [Chenopodium quinoa]|nr:transcription factor bHLH160-like isoform X1 [Chenopodium quinoa]
MSNPPFGNPLYNEEDDFSFPYQPPSDDPINFPPLIEDQNTLPNTSSLPMSEYQDLSIFLGEDHLEDYTLIEQYGPNTQDPINWVSPIEQVGLEHVQQGTTAEGSSQGHHELQYYCPTTTTTMMTTTTTTMIDDQTAAPADGGVREGSSSKKLDHNAKEKVRRMKLNETFLALRSLLPDSRRAKKRWSGPYIIDRALDYVPQLQAEIEKLTLEKSNMLSVLGKKQQLVVGSSDVRDANKDKKTLTVSMNEVKSGEVIVQICEQNNKVGILSTLIEKLEGQGIHVLGASSQRACENRSCFHLHVQMGESPVEADYVAVLHKKIISWLS